MWLIFEEYTGITHTTMTEIYVNTIDKQIQSW